LLWAVIGASLAEAVAAAEPSVTVTLPAVIVGSLASEVAVAESGINVMLADKPESDADAVDVAVSAVRDAVAEIIPSFATVVAVAASGDRV
jgi:hypothetical protein